MSTQRQTKPTIDAINDAVGAVSDLLHSLRAHARSAAKDVKAKATDVGRDVKQAGRSAVKAGKRTAKKAEAAGEGLLDRATKAWHGITGADEAPPAVAKRARRAKRRTSK